MDSAGSLGHTRQLLNPLSDCIITDAYVDGVVDMPRELPGGAPNGVGDYFDRVYKLIPAELTAAYLAVQSYLGVPENIEDNVPYLLVAGIFLTVLVPPYLLLLQNVSSRSQIAVSTFSLPIWILNISSAYVALHHEKWIKPFGLLLIGWVLVAPLIVAAGKRLNDN